MGSERMSSEQSLCCSDRETSRRRVLTPMEEELAGLLAEALVLEYQNHLTPLPWAATGAKHCST